MDGSSARSGVRRSGGRARRWRGGRSRHRGALTTKNHRHPALAARVPATSGPRALPAPLTAPQIPMAAGRRASSKVSITTASEVVKQAADAMPCTARAATSQPRSGATAHAALAPANPATPHNSNWRGPYRSARRPKVRSSAPKARALAFITHPRAVGPASNSRPIEGSRRPMPLTSSDWASSGSAIAASTSQARRFATVDVGVTTSRRRPPPTRRPAPPRPATGRRPPPGPRPRWSRG